MKSEFSELLEQKITSNGSKLCWTAKAGLAGLPALSPVTPQEVNAGASRLPLPDPRRPGLLYPGCCPPGTGERFPPPLCSLFLLSARPRWNNYDMAFKLQHPKP